jgi:hypothetical protein
VGELVLHQTYFDSVFIYVIWTWKNLYFYDTIRFCGLESERNKGTPCNEQVTEGVLPKFSTAQGDVGCFGCCH